MLCLGPHGAGKSTALATLQGEGVEEVEPTKGEQGGALMLYHCLFSSCLAKSPGRRAVVVFKNAVVVVLLLDTVSQLCRDEHMHARATHTLHYGTSL